MTAFTRIRFAAWFRRPPLGMLLLIAWTVGCASRTPLPPVDLAEAGWRLHRGQAVWKFRDDSPEVVGDLLVAVRDDARMFAQFSKGPLTVAVARTEASRWEIDLPMFQRRTAGRGEPDGRFAFFPLAGQLRDGEVPSPWQYSVAPDGRWRLDHSRTGESLEGFWEP